MKSLWDQINKRLASANCNATASFWSAGQLRLVDEGVSGYRHYLLNKAVRAGSALQVLIDDRWIAGRYEWSFSLERTPYLVLNDHEETVVTIADDSIAWAVVRETPESRRCKDEASSGHGCRPKTPAETYAAFVGQALTGRVAHGRGPTSP